MTKKTILIATKNPNKIREYREMLELKGYLVKTLVDFPEIGKIDENGSTFEENALIKASSLVKDTNLSVMADDSGLEVTALNGEPGVYSARYAGDHDDAANNQKLIKNLQDKQDRSATFVTCLVLLHPDNSKIVVNGDLQGKILDKPRGNNGFGYDPYFYVPEKAKTLAEMTVDEKNSISHRGRALVKMMKKME